MWGALQEAVVARIVPGAMRAGQHSKQWQVHIGVQDVVTGRDDTPSEEVVLHTPEWLTAYFVECCTCIPGCTHICALNVLADILSILVVRHCRAVQCCVVVKGTTGCRGVQAVTKRQYQQQVEQTAKAAGCGAEPEQGEVCARRARAELHTVLCGCCVLCVAVLVLAARWCPGL